MTGPRDDDGFQSRYFDGPDGLRLHARDYGADNPRSADHLPVICLPGLTRNSRDFHQLALLLSNDARKPRRVIALDYRGRGLSAWDTDRSHYNLVVEASDVLATAAAFEVPQAAFIGTSRGGLILHILAAQRPDLLAAVVLNDIGPVVELEGLIQIRDYLGNGRLPENWEEAADILRDIHGASFTALAAEDWRDMAYALYRKIDGKIVADFDPAIAEMTRSMDLSKLAPDFWPQFAKLTTVPLMVVRGENSALLSAETLTEMAKRHPQMTALTVPGQGHAPLLHLGAIPVAIEAFISAT
ncbi:alpha/beta hydrolase [Rhizobium sp. BK251]|uniref:alpha/beta fold hydrolase n=1 Tax=Rhizobium sp. BK251 TaxID=2512125 RepID=UPI00104AB30A|nr:alpha/beta hydrolase [Rhizobium sp. BK251]TCL70167.1 pimeloyl-ACP methyl ester carboxylesterase [Rhizobium sp. BK251]